jgi:nitrogen fixation NifU-like protein
VSSELRDLYQELILEHARKPRNFRVIEGGRRAEGFNPLCGDRCTVTVCLDGEVVKDVAFQGSGCAISTASASVMTESIKGMSSADAEALFGRFHDLVTGQSDLSRAEDLGKLAVFAGVSEFPARVKCASLAWHVMRAALHESHDVITTE